MGARRLIQIGPASLAHTAAGQRVTAEVDGVPVWFESPDLTLTPAPEAFLSAFLVPALAHGATPQCESALDPLWLEHSRELVRIFAKWWRYPALPPQAMAGPAAMIDSDDPRGRALFFSGGVDSFHGLLCCNEQVDLLVFLQGFDIPIGDQPRADAALRSLRSIAEATGIRSGFVRTNLREHPLMRATAWERTNGGALAGVAHVLAPEARELLISSSVAITDDDVFGSHWQTDPLFSSSRMRLRQVGQNLRRMDKIRQIAPEPLPRQHLRVCWANTTSTGNCSHCSKCVITRLVLAESGVLDDYSVFEGSATLARELDGMRSDRRLQTLDEISRSPRLGPELRRATRALYERSVRTYSLPVRLRRALVRKWLEWTRPKPT